MPGSYEIPLAARRGRTPGRYDAVVCLGAVIRGATAHFDYVAGGAVDGISSVALETGLPVIFGVITTETIEQAIERAGTKMGNKGFEAAVSAIEMADLLPRIKSGAPRPARRLGQVSKPAAAANADGLRRPARRVLSVLRLACLRWSRGAFATAFCTLNAFRHDGAGPHALRRAALLDPNLLQVRVPAAARRAQGVAARVAEARASFRRNNRLSPLQFLLC